MSTDLSEPEAAAIRKTILEQYHTSERTPARAARAAKLIAWCEGLPKRSGDQISFDESAAMMRDLITKNLVTMWDLREDPAWFFEAHRIIGCFGERTGQGFWIRFTVQFNLFSGTVLAIGNESQVASLRDMQAAGHLGCFGLTEKFAGVSSGLVVETIADYDPATKGFILTSPNEGAYKNWISQGFCADKAVVVADLRIGGKSYGPHGFLTDFRVPGASGKPEVVKGIRLADMGQKTVANDLDNAWIAFDGVRVPGTALLDRFSGVDEKGNFFTRQQGRMSNMEQIGQRLFTGRVGVAQVASIFGKALYARTKKYTDNKQCNVPGGFRPPLTALPQITKRYTVADEAFDYNIEYVKKVEAELCQCLLADKIPDGNLIEAVAISKVRCVETTIENIYLLKQTVGSCALFYGNGFESSDFMQVAKFAEGESFVLMSKLARDRVKNKNVVGSSPEEEALVAELRTMKPAQWATQFEKVYILAELVADRVQTQRMGRAPPAAVARPMAKL